MYHLNTHSFLLMTDFYFNTNNNIKKDTRFALFCMLSVSDKCDLKSKQDSGGNKFLPMKEFVNTTSLAIMIMALLS